MNVYGSNLNPQTFCYKLTASVFRPSKANALRTPSLKIRMGHNFVTYSNYFVDATNWFAHHMPTNINMSKKIWSLSLTFLTNGFYNFVLRKYIRLLIENTNNSANHYSGTELSECLWCSPNKILLIVLDIKMWHI
jgi:hypothetical protein